MTWPLYFEDIFFTAWSLPRGLPPWFQKNTTVSHLGENPVREWSQEGWRTIISFTPILYLPLGPKYSPLLYKRERERERKPVSLVLPRYFFYSPTTSLLPPSESFRIEKRPFTGEDLKGERKKLNLHRFANFFWECLSVSFWLGISVSTGVLLGSQGKYRAPTDSTDKSPLFCGCSQSRVVNKEPNKLVILFQFMFPFLFTHTDYSLSYSFVFFTFRSKNTQEQKYSVKSNIKSMEIYFGT